MRSMKRLVDLLLYSNVFIAIGAVCMVEMTEIMLTGDWELSWLSGAAFFGTLTIYLLSRENSLRRVEKPESTKRLAWMRTSRSWVLILVLIGAIGFLISYSQLSFYLQAAYIPVGLLALAYALPVIPTSDGVKRLRDIGWLKIILISGVWAYVTLLLPLWEFIEGIMTWEIWYMFIARFVFIFAITIPFDIKDMQLDARNKTFTFPILFGEKTSTRIAAFALGILVFAELIFSRNEMLYPSSIGLGLAISYLVALWLVSKGVNERGELYYYLVLDGLIVLMPLMVFGSFTIAKMFF